MMRFTKRQKDFLMDAFNAPTGKKFWAVDTSRLYPTTYLSFQRKGILPSGFYYGEKRVLPLTKLGVGLVVSAYADIEQS